MTQKANESQNFWITIFADELGRLLQGKSSGEDICSRQVINVLTQIDKFIARYPNALDCAKAMCYTCIIDFGRDEARQSGKGSRYGRVVESLTRANDDGGFHTIDIADLSATDPEAQAIARDLCRQEISKLKPVVAMGVELTAQGFNQVEAAAKIGVSRTYISRQMKQSQREMQRASELAAS